MKHVVMFSGGAGSWAAARRIADRHGTQDLTLLFADTKSEDEDLYRFITEAANDISVPVTTVADGRDIWQVFKDSRFLGNTRIDPCSRILKREKCREWLKANCDPQDTAIYLGYDWTEMHRVERAAPFWAPWTVAAPMAEEPLIDKAAMLDDLRARGIQPPRLYGLGMNHNNCGGGCVKAGVAHFLHLLKVFPERYAEWERNEEAIRQYLGKDIAILRDRSSTGRCKPCRGGGMVNGQLCEACDGTGKATRPLTLRELRENTPLQCDLFDWGGCGCFTETETVEGSPSQT